MVVRYNFSPALSLSCNELLRQKLEGAPRWINEIVDGKRALESLRTIIVRL